MISHAEAIAFFQDRGLHAERRVWSLGDCVVVAANPTVDPSSQIKVYDFVAWLVPEKACGWDLVEMVLQSERRHSFGTLDEACNAALQAIAAHNANRALRP